MRISKTLYDQMIVHAWTDAPNECCGLVASKNGDAVAVYPAINAEPSPAYFEFDPREQIELHEKIVGAGLEIGAIYHSHLHIRPIPSGTDIHFARGWPGVLWIIVGLSWRWNKLRDRNEESEPEVEGDGVEEKRDYRELQLDEPDVWTWRIENGRVYTAELTVVEDGLV